MASERPDIDRLARRVNDGIGSDREATCIEALDAWRELVALARGHDAAIERNCDLLERSTAAEAREAELKRERDSMAGTLLTALRTAEGFERRIAELEAALREIRKDASLLAALMQDYEISPQFKFIESIRARAALAGDGGSDEDCPAGHGDQCCGHPAECRAALTGDGDIPEINWGQARSDMPEKLAGDGGGA